MKYLKTIKPENKALIIVILIAAIVAFLATSCSVSENLLEHNKYDYKVISYEYPYAYVLSMPDSSYKYVFIRNSDIKDGGYIICDR